MRNIHVMVALDPKMVGAIDRNAAIDGLFGFVTEVANHPGNRISHGTFKLRGLIEIGGGDGDAIPSELQGRFGQLSYAWRQSGAILYSAGKASKKVRRDVDIGQDVRYAFQTMHLEDLRVRRRLRSDKAEPRGSGTSSLRSTTRISW